MLVWTHQSWSIGIKYRCRYVNLAGMSRWSYVDQDRERCYAHQEAFQGQHIGLEVNNHKRPEMEVLCKVSINSDAEKFLRHYHSYCAVEDYKAYCRWLVVR